MTDEEFNTWDRHRAENLQQQRDDAYAELERARAEHEATVRSLTEGFAARESEIFMANQKAISDLIKEHEDWKVRDAKRRELDQKIAEIEQLKRELG